jgi:hypothetical protein
VVDGLVLVPPGFLALPGEPDQNLGGGAAGDEIRAAGDLSARGLPARGVGGEEVAPPKQIEGSRSLSPIRPYPALALLGADASAAE